MPTPRTLDQLRIGEKGTILDVQGDDELSIRLMEMGLIEGESVERIGQAPFGDPLEYSIQGYRLSLRIAEAARVLIEN